MGCFQLGVASYSHNIILSMVVCVSTCLKSFAVCASLSTIGSQYTLYADSVHTRFWVQCIAKCIIHHNIIIDVDE